MIEKMKKDYQRDKMRAKFRGMYEYAGSKPKSGSESGSMAAINE